MIATEILSWLAFGALVLAGTVAAVHYGAGCWPGECISVERCIGYVPERME
jgi:hypothetical protein